MKGLALLIAKKAAGKGKDDEETSEDVDLGQELIDAIKDGNAADVKATFKDLLKECLKENKAAEEDSDDGY